MLYCGRGRLIIFSSIFADAAYAEAAFNFTPLFIVLLLAFVTPILLARFRRVPVVVGEILAGLVVGGSVLGWVQEDLIIALMGDIGLAFLMFLAGLEIDFDMLLGAPPVPAASAAVKRRRTPNLLLLAGAVHLLTMLLAGGGALLLNTLGMEGNPWLLAFILSATSLGVLLPVLKERGLSRTPFGQVVFVSATLADFVTAILLTVFLIIHANGLDPQILTIILLFLFFFIATRVGAQFSRLPGARRLVEELSRSTVQLKVRGALAILLAFVVLAEFVNAELILGAFLAGMVISLIKSNQDEALVEKLEAFGFGLFIPVFFILVGVNLDLGALLAAPENLLVLPVFLLISLVVKVLPLAAARSLLGWKEILAGGLLLNTHLSLEIAVSVIGLRAGLLSPAAATTVTLFAVLTVLIMPLLFGFLAPEKPVKKERSILIGNAGQEGLNIARELQAHGEPVCILDDNPQVLEAARKAGYPTLPGNPAELPGLLNPQEHKGVLALCLDDTWNLNLGRAAAQVGLHPVIGRVNDPANLAAYRAAGLQPYLPSLAQNTLLALMARNPDFYSLLTSATDGRLVREIDLENPLLTKRRLRELPWPGETLVLAISRNEDVIIPHGNVQLESGDRLTLLCALDELPEIEALLKNGIG